jgi:hypothetical protein
LLTKIRVKFSKKMTFGSFTSSLTLVLLAAGLLATEAATTSVLEEYCDDKSFVPTCSASDEVIIMEQATYGRMRLGKCVPTEHAYILGCSADVLSFVEMRCSGRRTCSGILKDAYAMGICESLYRNYLEASYSCTRGK